MELTKIEIESLRARRGWMPDLARWHHAQWASYNPGETLDDRVARLERHAADDEVPLTWVASRAGVLLGSASLVVSDMETKPELTPWLASVFVAPEHRREGVGSLLVNQVKCEAADRGFPRLFLFTPDREAFYERLGWVVVERLDYRDSQVTLMALDLR